VPVVVVLVAYFLAADVFVAVFVFPTLVFASPIALTPVLTYLVQEMLWPAVLIVSAMVAVAEVAATDAAVVVVVVAAVVVVIFGFAAVDLLYLLGAASADQRGC